MTRTSARGTTSLTKRLASSNAPPARTPSRKQVMEARKSRTGQRERLRGPDPGKPTSREPDMASSLRVSGGDRPPSARPGGLRASLQREEHPPLRAGAAPAEHDPQPEAGGDLPDLVAHVGPDARRALVIHDRRGPPVEPARPAQHAGLDRLD